MSNQAEQLRLKIPPQDLEMLSFAIANPKKIQEWVDGLPRMNIGECAKQLYAAIQEVNRYKTDSDSRFQMLEVLRSPIRYVCESLGKHYLNKAVVLPPKEAKIASLAQALQNHLSIGYKAVIVQLLPRLKVNEKDARKLGTKSIHRAFTEQAEVLLRSLQLYYPAPINFWREAHLLYAISERFGVLNAAEHDAETTKDPQATSTCYDMYKRILLLSTAKPNQLRQNQIKQVYDATAHWAQFTTLAEDSPHNGLFAIDLISDTPPIYNALMKRPNNVNICYFDAATISDHLRVQLQLPSNQAHPIPEFKMPADMGKDVIRLLIQAWGVLTERAFTRIEEAGHLAICIGLSSTHYFVSDKADFNATIRDAEQSGVMGVDFDNQFMNTGPTHRRDVVESHDVWGLQVDSDNGALSTKQNAIEQEIAKFSGQELTAESDKYPSYFCDIVNTSPGGYCLSWKQDVPPQVKTGEIIGLQEDEKALWSIGVIRWVKQFKNEGARMGVELLAPKAEACGSQAIHKKGGVTEYMRTLILPELRAIGQPATLITPNIAFHVGYKVNMNQNGHVIKAQLVKQVSSTASFNQFQYKPLTATTAPAKTQQPASPAAAPKSKQDDDDFDSIWSSL